MIKCREADGVIKTWEYINTINGKQLFFKSSVNPYPKPSVEKDMDSIRVVLKQSPTRTIIHDDGEF